MAKSEANFDRFIDELLKSSKIYADYQGSNVIDINNALKSASKKQNGKVGFPEYTALVNDYVIVIENKSDKEFHCLKNKETEILRQYFINHPQSIDKYTFLQNSAFTHWVKEKCSKMC